MLEHLVDAATGLDRTGDGQVAVALEPQRADLAVCLGLFTEQRQHLRQGQDVRLDDPATGGRLREHSSQIGRETREACAGIGHIRGAQPHIAQRLADRCHSWVEPAGFLQGDQLIEQRILRAPLGERLAKDHRQFPHCRQLTASIR